MEKRNLGKSNLSIEPLIVGTWAFGGGSWWGPQEDKFSVEVLEAALSQGLRSFDTAPIYGKGRSERVIGDFVYKRKIREKVILATKTGLSWQGSRIFHDLSKKRMLEELDESRNRLKTDYIDLYQVHWPDPNVEISDSAETMLEIFKKNLVKAVGVSNYSIAQMKEFLKYCPIHSLQPQYSMFERSIEKEIIGFCQENNIAVITYAPLYSGILTGKFFFEKNKIPQDVNRKMKMKDLTEPAYSINKEALSKIRGIAQKYNKTLSQLVINWNFSQKGITSAIVGMRNLKQAEENLGSLGFSISEEDKEQIDIILRNRTVRINQILDTRY
ncbi:MAG: aldo/keto reductase [Candidatus Omnitrophica bacterium]|nr:aldo/keto reductase [Candidatus Omnitrophota bacterium]